MIREANLHWQYQDTDTGLLMPWYTLPALEWLKKQDISKWRVFEYGAGYSTIWWRANCQEVFGVEWNPFWYKAMNGRDDDLVFCETPADYIQRIHFCGGFNCVVIDGEFRDACIEFSKNHIMPGGYMIIDNYGQTDFPPSETIDALLEGWEKQIFKQPNHSDWCTAVFRKP